MIKINKAAYDKHRNIHTQKETAIDLKKILVDSTSEATVFVFIFFKVYHTHQGSFPSVDQSLCLLLMCFILLF